MSFLNRVSVYQWLSDTILELHSIQARRLSLKELGGVMRARAALPAFSLAQTVGVSGWWWWGCSNVATATARAAFRDAASGRLVGELGRRWGEWRRVWQRRTNKDAWKEIHVSLVLCFSLRTEPYLLLPAENSRNMDAPRLQVYVFNLELCTPCFIYSAVV